MSVQNKASQKGEEIRPHLPGAGASCPTPRARGPPRRACGDGPGRPACFFVMGGVGGGMGKGGACVSVVLGVGWCGRGEGGRVLVC